MKAKGFTLIEIFLVSMLASIVLLGVMMPAFSKFTARSKLREVRMMVELIRGPAKLYHEKEGIDTIMSFPTTLERWQALEVVLPRDRNCDYEINQSGPDVELQVFYPRKAGGPIGAMVYRYILPDGDINGQGTIVSGSGYEKYLQGLNLP